MSSPRASVVRPGPASSAATATCRSAPPGPATVALAVERDGDGRQLGGGIGVRDAADDRATVARRGMADERERLRQQRGVRGDQRRALRRALAHERADPQPPVVLALDRIQPGQRGEVDQQLGRRRQPCGERRNQALAAGEHPRAVAAQQLGRGGDRRRAGEREGRQAHRAGAPGGRCPGSEGVRRAASEPSPARRRSTARAGG